ncbi:MAG: hypothetical protein PHN42_00155 [Bacilli bacterium]|nr:hypothetical protein [Bacilli bacterium]
MSSKKLKKIINDSINIESKEFLSNLLNNSEIKNVRIIRKERTKLVFRFAMFILLISICFINLNNDKSRVNKFDNNKIKHDIINVNNFPYDVDEQGNYPIFDNVNGIISRNIDITSINNLFKVNIVENRFANYYIINECNYSMPQNTVISCTVNLNSKINSNSKMQIKMTNGAFPLFDDEINDKWEVYIKENNFLISKINDFNLIIVQNTNNEFNNYKTKFIIEKIGISIDSYDMNLEEIKCLLKIIINSIK